ncbi:hypothetical protein P8452_76506 [Trifolium repens]|nr:hypothetical protein P8452_76506 [Trifolium repens]
MATPSFTSFKRILRKETKSFETCINPHERKIQICPRFKAAWIKELRKDFFGMLRREDGQSAQSESQPDADASTTLTEPATVADPAETDREPDATDDRDDVAQDIKVEEQMRQDAEEREFITRGQQLRKVACFKHEEWNADW